MSSKIREKVRRTIMALERPVTQESNWSLKLNEYLPLSLRMNLQTKKTKIQDKSALKRGDTNLNGFQGLKLPLNDNLNDLAEVDV